eukprot:jgi/Botrbrau1/9324/Bobra.0086s0008.1
MANAQIHCDMAKSSSCRAYQSTNSWNSLSCMTRVQPGSIHQGKLGFPSGTGARIKKNLLGGSCTMSTRKTGTASAFLLDAPAPLFHVEPTIHVEHSFELRSGAEKEADWLTHVPVEALLKLSFEASGPQGLLGVACFMGNSTPLVAVKGGSVPFAPPLRDDSFTDLKDDFDEASCLATPFLLESEESFRLAHVQQMQRLAQESEIEVQLRYARDLLETEMLHRLKAMPNEQAHRFYRSLRRREATKSFAGMPDLFNFPEEMFSNPVRVSASSSTLSSLDEDERQLISNIFTSTDSDGSLPTMHAFTCEPRDHDVAMPVGWDAEEADYNDDPHLSLLALDRCHDCRLLHFCSCKAEVPTHY